MSETYAAGKNSKRTPRVRDVIPSSRLAQYGNYEYNEEREKMYNYDVAHDMPWAFEIRHEKEKKKMSWYEEEDVSGSQVEPWMSRQVEECFVRLLSLPTTLLLAGKNEQQYDDENG